MVLKMIKWALIIIGIITVLGFFGYNLIPEETDRPFRELGMLDCGIEENVFENGLNMEGRNCFYDAFQECKVAKFKVISTTMEGDTLIDDLRVLGREDDGRCAMSKFFKSDDKFGIKGELGTICYGLKKIPLLERSNEFNLRFDDCEEEVVGSNLI